MMHILYDPDEYESTCEFTPCPYHRDSIREPHPGCTCSTLFGQRKRSPEDIAVIKVMRRLAHEESVLAEADAIRARRAVRV